VICLEGDGIQIKAAGGKLLINVLLLAVVMALIVYSLLDSANLLAVDPANIMQAGNARFYENFIYNYSKNIPRGCIVLTYDPGLFNINNLSAAQMSYALNSAQYQGIVSEYSCVIIDYGYWCGTPDNICSSVLNQFTVEELASATYQQTGFTYALYRVTGSK